MALNSSGQLSLGGAVTGQSVNLELGKSATAIVSMNDTDLRTLFGIASGQISMSNGYGKSSGATKTILGVANLWRFDFATEASTDIAAAAITTRAQAMGVNTSEKGYWGGGVTGPFQAQSAIDGILFSTETTIDPAATLVQSRGNGGTWSSTSKGYFAGGSCGQTFNQQTQAQIDALLFSSETIQDTAASTISAKSFTTGIQSPEKGYTGGGFLWTGGFPAPQFRNDITGLIFSTETAIDPAAAACLSSNGGVNTTTKGYWAGGRTTPAGTVQNSIQGFTFSTETASNESATLVQSRALARGAESSSKGYFIGGSSPATTLEIDGILFSTETAINPAATAFNSPSATPIQNSTGIS